MPIWFSNKRYVVIWIYEIYEIKCVMWECMTIYCVPFKVVLGLRGLLVNGVVHLMGDVSQSL